jgi:hypothetical protein
MTPITRGSTPTPVRSHPHPPRSPRPLTDAELRVVLTALFGPASADRGTLGVVPDTE